MRIFPGLIKLKRENWRRFKKKFRKRQEEFLAGEITEKKFTHSIMSLIGHIRHADTWHLLQQFLQRYCIDI